VHHVPVPGGNNAHISGHKIWSVEYKFQFVVTTKIKMVACFEHQQIQLITNIYRAIELNQEKHNFNYETSELLIAPKDLNSTNQIISNNRSINLRRIVSQHHGLKFEEK
jgi:hypothetical protein